MHENFPVGGIITGGLGYDACNGLITTKFHLWCGIEIVVTPPKPSGGGPYPGKAHNKFAPGEIQNFYQPVPPEQQYYVVPRDQEARYFQRHKHIVVKFKMGEFAVEKEFAVPEKRAKAIVKVLNVLNNTRTRINVGVSNVKRMAGNLTVAVSKLRSRHK